MATERLSMRQIREILRQKWVLTRSHRQVAASLAVSLRTVTGVLRRATHAGLEWFHVQTLTEVSGTRPIVARPAPPPRPRPKNTSTPARGQSH